MKWFTALLLSIALMGCSSSNTAGISVESKNQQVLFGDNVLGARLVINNAGSSDTNGILKGVVSMTSTYTGDQHLQYRFYWYDKQGLEVNGSDTPWRQFIVRGLDSMSIQGVAIDPNATQFRVQIRSADD